MSEYCRLSQRVQTRTHIHTHTQSVEYAGINKTEMHHCSTGTAANSAGSSRTTTKNKMSERCCCCDCAMHCHAVRLLSTGVVTPPFRSVLIIY